MLKIDMIFKIDSICKLYHLVGYVIMVKLISHSQMLLADAYPSNYYHRNFSIPTKSEVRRGINIDLQVATEAPSSKLKLQEVLEDMMQAAQEGLEESDSVTLCPTCSDLLKEKPLRKIIEELRPGYPCDDWDPKERTCIFDRNIGDSVTFVLDIPQKKFDNSLHIVWMQEFEIMKSKTRKNFTIDPTSPPWNMVIGSKASELRLSPITELDIDFNYFSATVNNGEDTELPTKRKVIFKIRVMPIDQGTLYPGAFLMLNMLSSVSLPESSMTFKWYMEDDNEMKSLPSNMRVSSTGGLLTISELRKEQQGIMSCAVYTNLNVFATKKRFLIKSVSQENNRLMFLPTRSSKYHREISQRLYRNKRQFESNFFEDETRKSDESAFLDHVNPNKEDYIDLNKTPSSKSESLENRKYDENTVKEPFLPDKDESKSDSDESKKYDENVVKEPFISDKTEYTGPIKKPSSKSESVESRKYDDNADFIPKKDEYTDPNKKSNPTFEFVKKSKYDDDGFRIYLPSDKNNYMPSYRKSSPKLDSSDDVSVDVTEGPQFSTLSDEKYEEMKTRLTTSDKIAMLISKCDADFECSTYASCIKMTKTEPGFCRCLPRFEGNGIFCWEVHKSVT
ncbi:uncharacterized protein [Parasteatoda tepidariorum]|uniref:uncharacterized protein n=1 Tax=Parasteatoda tepidariorum TaxID=114398 RepID=UPI001C723B49|nr:uncharacterized protein LOC107455824 isoform X1 [Parasteatoda tepidariorum]